MTRKATPGKPGRKPLPTSQKRSRMIRVMVQPEEFARIRKAAGVMPLSAYLRACALPGR